MDRVLNNAIVGLRDSGNERNTRDLDIWASSHQPMRIGEVHVGLTSVNMVKGLSMKLLATQPTIAFEGQTSLNHRELVAGSVEGSRSICTRV